MTPTEEIIVVLGLDADSKPRAVKFNKADEKTARKVATARQFKIGIPKTDDAMETALALVDGKTFKTGRGLMPLVNAQTYEKLLSLLKIEEPGPAETTAKPSPAPTASTDPWANIAAGTTVLCREGKDGGWWPCKVIDANDGKSLMVGWVGFSTMKPFSVKRTAVAILPPKG